MPGFTTSTLATSPEERISNSAGEMWSVPESAIFGIDPNPIHTPSIPTLSTTAIVDRIREASRARIAICPAANPSNSHLALDDEATHDEELYLAGTASEKDALILNNLTMGDSSFGPEATEVPGLRIRVVSPNVSFVFYKTLPYGMDPDQAVDSCWARVEALMGREVAYGVVDR